MISPKLLLVLFLTCCLEKGRAISTYTSAKGLHINDQAYTLAEEIYIDVNRPIQAIRVGVMLAHGWPEDLEGNSISIFILLIILYFNN